MLGAARPAVLKSNRERGLSARVPRPPRRSREAVTPSAWLDLSELSCGDGGDVHVTHRVSDLQQFPLQQFRCSPGRLLDLSQPGVLVLYTSQVSIVSAFLRAGAPWVLSFDSQKGADQDLACSALQLRLEGLISAGAFRVVGGFPPCGSFSRAIRPPVRSRARPQGLCDFSPHYRAKVEADNAAAAWIRHLRELCVKCGLLYWFAQPDTSFFWLLPGWEDEAWPRGRST